jgi:hypothetical protein
MMANSDNFWSFPRPEKFPERESVAGIDDAGRIGWISFAI